tara:strand:+ start:18771 stop:19919 length:1149 start_codon:yes stop_codon:yes gene_type:complete
MADANPILDLALALMERPSVTPEDAGCQELLGQRLRQLGFHLESMPAGEVDNLWATHGEGAPYLVLAGHTDVVPPGPEQDWDSPPFEPSLRNGLLYGRGAADMKSSLAAMVVASEEFLARHPKHRGTLAFLVTSDEEGPAVQGTRHVIAELAKRGIQLDYCVVGEPSSSLVIGDTVRVGRRGSLNATLRIRGQQGHVAYPDQAENPVHNSAAALCELTAMVWDAGNESFPPTSLQISNIRAGTGATNVIPGELTIEFNVRFNTEQTVEGIQQRITELLDQHQQNYQLDWEVSGLPFLTPAGMLREITAHAVADITGRRPEESTSGGTSDGRFIAPTGCEVVELGPVNESIHKINEHVQVDDLIPLARIYQTIVERLLGPDNG